MDKEDVVYIYNGILLNHKKEIMRFAATWMNPEAIMLSEISQTEKDRYCMMSHVLSKKRQGLGVGGLGKSGQKVQNSSYKINKYWGYNVQHDDYS